MRSNEAMSLIASMLKIPPAGMSTSGNLAAASACSDAAFLGITANASKSPTRMLPRIGAPPTPKERGVPANLQILVRAQLRRIYRYRNVRGKIDEKLSRWFRETKRIRADTMIERGFRASLIIAQSSVIRRFERLVVVIAITHALLFRRLVHGHVPCCVFSVRYFRATIALNLPILPLR